MAPSSPFPCGLAVIRFIRWSIEVRVTYCVPMSAEFNSVLTCRNVNMVSSPCEHVFMSHTPDTSTLNFFDCCGVVALNHHWWTSSIEFSKKTFCSSRFNCSGDQRTEPCISRRKCLSRLCSNFFCKWYGAEKIKTLKTADCRLHNAQKTAARACMLETFSRTSCFVESTGASTMLRKCSSMTRIGCSNEVPQAACPWYRGIFDATFYCLTVAARDHHGACFGGSDGDPLLFGERLFCRPRVLESGQTVPEVSF